MARLARICGEFGESGMGTGNKRSVALSLRGFKFSHCVCFGESIYLHSVGFRVCASLGNCTWLICLFFRGIRTQPRRNSVSPFSFAGKSGEWPLPVSRYEKFMISSSFKPLCQHLKILYFTLAPLRWSMINKPLNSPSRAGDTFSCWHK